LNKREYDLFLSRTTIKPATSHLSNHSLVNEWAIYQWAKLINSEDNNCFHQIFSKIDTDLYFNYLKALHPISRQNVIDRKDLEIRFSGEAPKVLLIDDESDKGWADLFVDIFEEFYFYDIPSYDFKNKSLNELLKFCLNNIEELKIDLVILDFRLLPQDHIVNKLEEISSIKLLKAIKLYNPGIQVVVFSATDKVWNLNALQRAGADGFVNKGASIELQNKYSVKKSIESLVEQVQESMSLRYLKTIFTLLYKIKNNIKFNRKKKKNL
jgi:CheY-like chemotaxis protein